MGEERKEAPGTPPPARVAVARKLQWFVSDLTVGRGKSRKTVVRGIKGEARSNQLIALLGPSGAGKTSLLECISLRNKGFTGCINLDGKPLSGDFFTLSALVYQREALFGFLKVREHLIFHAVARMGRDHSHKAIMARVEQVIKETKLSKCADTIIGGTDPIYMMKGISGGERKRVALATELLRAPEIIFLDEPTSGLDSVMSESVVATLRELASGGRMVVTSIHCPSSDLMRYFTHLVLLTYDGRLAYHGERAKAVEHFQHLGYAYPKDYNPADYLLKCCSRGKDDTTEEEEVEERRRIDRIVDAFDSEPAQVALELVTDDRHKAFNGVQGLKASSWTLFVLNYWRFMIQFKRDFVTFALWALVSMTTGMLYGTLYYQQATGNWRNLVGLAFSLIVSVLMLGSMSMVVRMPLDWGVFQREYSSGSNAVGPYVAARFLGVWPFLFAPMLMATVVYWMTGMAPGFQFFMEFAGIVVLSCLCSLSLGTMISACNQNLLVCLSLLPGVITPMILFSGLLYQRDTVPSWLSWIQSVSIVNYGFSAIVIQQVPVLPPNVGKMVLQFLSIDSSLYKFDIAMLAVLTVVFQAATYVVLKTRFYFTSAF